MHRSDLFLKKLQCEATEYLTINVNFEYAIWASKAQRPHDVGHSSLVEDLSWLTLSEDSVNLK